MHRIDAAAARRRMGRDDDGVAGHQRDQRLEIDRGDRMGGRRQGEDHAGGPWDLDDLRRRIDARVDEVPVAIMLDQDRARLLVLELLVGGDAEARLAHRPFGIFAGLGESDLGHGVGDRIGARPVVALEHLARPARPLQHHVGARLQRGFGGRDVDKALDGGVHHTALRRALPRISRRAAPIATSTRRSSSSESSCVIRMPGLN